MKVVLLTGSTSEAEAFAKGAGLRAHDVFIPRSATAARGLELDEGDLVLQFPSWRDIPEGRRRDIRLELRRGFVGVGPDWQYRS